MYIKTINGAYEKPYSIGQLRKDNPNTSFPKYPTDALLAEWGVYPVAAASQPSHNPSIEKVVEDTPVNVAGTWTQVWKVISRSADEIADIANQQASSIRTERDGKLAASDWTQVADAPVDKAAWATYRQALRDITAQEGFPTFVDWPVAP